MSAFRFNPNARTLEIEGHIFEVRIGDIEKVGALVKLEREARTEDRPALDDDPLGLRWACAHMGRWLDTALGEGAYEKIFAGRPLNLVEHRAVVDYVSAELFLFQAERARAFLGKAEAPAVTTAVEPDDPAA